MKKPLLCVQVMLFSILIFISNILSAQTFTPRYNVSMTTHSKGFYEYLPEGYGSGNQKYPLLIFFHGAGEKGDGSASQLSKVLVNGTPKQINAGIFPKTFTVNGNTYSFIVLVPQITDSPMPYDVDNIINYAIKNYRVDTLRIYLTGLSMGGGVVWEYPGESFDNARRVSAIVPVCGAAWPANFRCENIAADNLPVWATHNDGDPTVPVTYTTGFVNGINSQNPPPNPKAKMTIFSANSHDAWTKTYDLNFKENGMNVYEWMLQFEKLSALAVSGLQFDVKSQNGIANLTWSTIGESNNKGFEVERSNNGNHFDSLTFIGSAGNFGQRYQYTDFTPLPGDNYYRLKLTEATGRTSYSEVRHVFVSGSNSILLYPNPVQGELHIRNRARLNNGQLRITDMSGKTIMNTIIYGEGDHTVPLKLPSGIYVATLTEGGKVIFKQNFIKK